MQKPERFRTLRGFLKEFGIIVLGVLTALGLQETVVWAQHRSDVRDAVARLRAESIDNRATLAFSIGKMREYVRGVNARLEVLGNCSSPVDVAKLAAVTPSATLLPSDTAWLGVRDSALMPLMPKTVVNNYWDLNSASSLLLTDLQDVIQRTDDARAAVDLVRRGIRDPRACVDAVHSLLRMRASLKSLWGQLVFYQSGNEQVLQGKRLGVGDAKQAIRDATTSLKGH